MSRPYAQYVVALSVLLVGAGSARAQAPSFKEPPTIRPTKEEQAAIESKIAALTRAVAELKARPEHDDPRTGEPLSDVTVYLKAAQWIGRFGEFYSKNDPAITIRVLD